MWSDLTFGPLIQGKIKPAKIKGVYIFPNIDPRVLGCGTNLQEIFSWESFDIRFDGEPIGQFQTGFPNM